MKSNHDTNLDGFVDPAERHAFLMSYDRYRPRDPYTPRISLLCALGIHRFESYSLDPALFECRRCVDNKDMQNRDRSLLEYHRMKDLPATAQLGIAGQIGDHDAISLFCSR